MGNLRVGVIGVGNIGRHHARNYFEMKGVKLVGICDTNIQVGKGISKLYGTQFYENYLQLIKTEKPDAISLAVPTYLHKSMALKIIDQGIHLLVEKPLASNVKDALAISKRAKEKGIILTVGHIERFNPVIIKLKEIVKEKVLGDILSIVVKRVGLYPPQIKDVNVVTDIAVHDLDIIANILGRMPISLFARGSGALTNGRTDHAEIYMDYGKFGCFIQTNWITPIKIRTLSITGTKGHAELNYVTQHMSLYKSNYRLDRDSEFKEFKEFVVRFGEPEKVRVTIRKKEPLRLELDHFVNCVRKKLSPEVSPEDSIRALGLADSVNKSIDKHKVIYLNDYGTEK